MTDTTTTSIARAIGDHVVTLTGPIESIYIIVARVRRHYENNGVVTFRAVNELFPELFVDVEGSIKAIQTGTERDRGPGATEPRASSVYRGTPGACRASRRGGRIRKTRG